MEALVAVGIACNVMQVLSFAHEVITLCKRVHHNKSPEPTLAQNGKHLEAVAKSLAGRLSQRPHPLMKPDQELLDIAQRCSEAARELIDEVGFLTTHPDGRNRLWATMKTTAKSLLRKSRLERLQKDLAGYQRSMETTILVQVCSKTEALEIQQREGFEQLANDLKSFIERIAMGHTRLPDLIVTESARSREVMTRESAATRNAVAAESQLTRDVVTSGINQDIRESEAGIKAHVTLSTSAVESSLSRELQSLSSETENARARELFLNSLRFPTMNDRRNRVSISDSGTFHWIFKDYIDQTDNIINDLNGLEQEDEDWGSDLNESGGESEVDVDFEELVQRLRCFRGTHLASWDNFRAWLESEEKIYWINGKPGSGKSTLMKFIISREETKTALEKWRPGCRLISHFLWSAGTDPLQRNVKGLLCSLIYQAVDMRTNWVDGILRNRPTLARKINHYDWDVGELRALASEVLTTSEHPFVIFMDGLDEVAKQDEAYELVGLIEEWRSLPCIKMCVSSRPEHIFSSSLSKYPSLRIHELSYMDLVKHAFSLLKGSFPAFGNRDDWIHLLSTLVDKAQGVFLWLGLVAKSLRRGLDNGDSFGECLRRIDSLPPDIMQLYQEMWARLGDDIELYRATAMKFFNLVMAAKPHRLPLVFVRSSSISIFQLTAASDDLIQEAFFGQGRKSMTISQIRQRCETTIQHLGTRCAGLLEISTIKGPYTNTGQDSGAYDSLLLYTRMQVDFIHRTAYEFFETQEGRKLLMGENPATKFKDAVVRLFKANLITALLKSFRLDSNINVNVMHFLRDLCSIFDILEDTTECNSLLSLVHRWYDDGIIMFNSDWSIDKPLKCTQPPFYFLVAYQRQLASFAQAHVNAATFGLYGCEYMDGLLFSTCSGLPFPMPLPQIRRQLELIRHLIQHGASLDHQRAYPIWALPYWSIPSRKPPNCVETETPVDRLLAGLTRICWPGPWSNLLDHKEIQEYRSLSSTILSIIDALLDAGTNLSHPKTICFFPSRVKQIMGLVIADRNGPTFYQFYGSPGLEVEVTRAVLLDYILHRLHPEVQSSSRLERVKASRVIRIRTVTKFEPKNENLRSYPLNTSADSEKLLRIARSWLVGGFLSTPEEQIAFQKARETDAHIFEQLCEKFLKYAEAETWVTAMSRQGLSFSTEDLGPGGYPLYQDPKDVEDDFKRRESRVQSLIGLG